MSETPEIEGGTERKEKTNKQNTKENLISLTENVKVRDGSTNPMVFKLLGWEWELQLNGYIFAGGKTHLHLNAALVHMCTSKSCTEHKNSKIDNFVQKTPKSVSC